MYNFSILNNMAVHNVASTSNTNFVSPSNLVTKATTDNTEGSLSEAGIVGEVDNEIVTDWENWKWNP